MKFIELEQSQYALIARHYAETYNAPPWNDQWTEDIALEKLSEMMDCRGAFGIACYDENENFSGVILGNPEIFYDCKQFFIKDFFVPLALQGRGIGSLLIAELEKRLAPMGIQKLTLMTSRGERTEGYYKKRGFRSCDRMVLMGKPISGE